MGGTARRMRDTDVAVIARHPGASDEERALRNVIFTTCLSEMNSVSYFVASLERMEDPYLRDFGPGSLPPTRCCTAVSRLRLPGGVEPVPRGEPGVARASVSSYLRFAFAVVEREFTRGEHGHHQLSADDLAPRRGPPRPGERGVPRDHGGRRAARAEALRARRRGRLAAAHAGRVSGRRARGSRARVSPRSPRPLGPPSPPRPGRSIDRAPPRRGSRRCARCVSARPPRSCVPRARPGSRSTLPSANPSSLPRANVSAFSPSMTGFALSASARATASCARAASSRARTRSGRQRHGSSTGAVEVEVTESGLASFDHTQTLPVLTKTAKTWRTPRAGEILGLLADVARGLLVDDLEGEALRGSACRSSGRPPLLADAGVGSEVGALARGAGEQLGGAHVVGRDVGAESRSRARSGGRRGVDAPAWPRRAGCGISSSSRPSGFTR